MLYTISIRNGIAKSQAAGYESFTTMPEHHVWDYMKEVTRIANAEGVEIEWKIIEQ